MATNLQRSLRREAERARWRQNRQEAAERERRRFVEQLARRFSEQCNTSLTQARSVVAFVAVTARKRESDS
jgi:hypothetical protein